MCLDVNEERDSVDFVARIEQESVVQMNTILFSLLPHWNASVTHMYHSQCLDVLTKLVHDVASNLLLEGLHLEDTSEIEDGADVPE